MIKVSHELPLCMQRLSNSLNDYEFCLPTYWHKYKEYKEYREYFLEAKQAGRFIIADNGLFEGDTFTEEQLIDFVNELQPDIFVIPDVWNAAQTSLHNAMYWQNYIREYLPAKTKLMAVIQCTDFEIGSKLYEDYITLGIECIAFNHSSIAYSEFFPHENLSVSKMMGRIYFINQLKSKKIINPDIHHHLLGCANFLEFKTYNHPNYSFIKTADTSNPVIFGLKEQKYTFSNCWDKPIEKIEEWFDKEITSKQLDCILVNIREFKNLLK
jgi:hypothetical protein